MDEIISFFTPSAGKKAKVALFLSGQGSNARKLLEAALHGTSYVIVLLVTDAPETSAARGFAQEFHVPLVECDIKKFYADHGENDTKLNTPHKQQLRNEWSEELYRKIAPYAPDFGVLAGFVSLTNVVSRIPCLNVHPGDLTLEENGRRVLAGLHLRPVENAILRGNAALRSSVILTQGYVGAGKQEVDSGPVLGISAPMPVDLQGHSLAELREINDARQGKPAEDALRTLARINVDNLKIHGDHLVLPAVTELFARGCYGLAGGNLMFREEDGQWYPVQSVEFFPDGSHVRRTESPAAPLSRRERRNRFFRSCRSLYLKMVRERGTPDYIARGWALGVWVGCVIPVFCQLAVSIPLSFVLRGSKIGAAAGTFVTTPPTAVFIYPVQIWVGLRLIGASMTLDEIRLAISELLERNDFQSFLGIGEEIITAFFAGGLLWSAFMTPLTYFLVRLLVVRYRRFREERKAAKEKNKGKQA